MTTAEFTEKLLQEARWRSNRHQSLSEELSAAEARTPKDCFCEPHHQCGHCRYVNKLRGDLSRLEACVT